MRDAAAAEARRWASRPLTDVDCPFGTPDGQRSDKGDDMKGEKSTRMTSISRERRSYGITLEEILSGQRKVPPQGARIDVAFAGRAIGRVAGPVRGVDYLRLRADGRIDLDIRATIETDDGHRSDRAVGGRSGSAACRQSQSLTYRRTSV